MLELRLLGGIGLQGSQLPEAEGILRQPKRLALLAYLAVAPAARFERRDRLVAIFWPEMDEERARRGLRQSLHVLRAAFGADALERRGDAEIALSAHCWRCDARDVTQLLDAGEWRAALDRYAGELLPGFHLSEAPAFERWLEDTRETLRRRVSKAAETAATEALAAADETAALSLLRRALALAPENEILLRHLMMTLDRAGDRVGALHEMASFERRLREDFESALAPETLALAASLRVRSAAGTAHAQRDDADRLAGALASGEAATGHTTRVDAPSAAVPVSRASQWPRRAAIGVAACLLFAAFIAGSRRNNAATAASTAAPPAAPPPATALTPARLLYEQGIALWNQGDASSAERLMAAALEQDSSFALARLQLGHLLGSRGEHLAGQRLQRDAWQQAASQTDHDRLLILALFAERFQLPSQWAVAETLAIRYPDNVEGQLLVAKARRQAGEFVDALPPLRRVAYGREAVLPSASERCFRCEAFGLLTVTYESLDSTLAVERTTHDWTVAYPASAEAWAVRAYQLSAIDRYQEALAALRRSEDIRAGAAGAFAMEEVLLRAGDFSTVSSILQLRRRGGSTRIADGARFLEWKSLREQGRFREALALADSHETATHRRRSSHDLAVTMRAQSLTDAGRALEAIAVWDSLGRLPVSAAEPHASVAGATAGRLANLATALARAGDTTRLAATAETLREVGAQSGWARNHRLHWYVRGELSLARGHYQEACRQLTASLVGATTTFAAANLSAGRACLRAGQPELALRAARGVLRGPVGAGGAWGTLSEAREIAGRALAALGQPDSAAAHLSRATEAWRNADAGVRGRLATVSAAARAPASPLSPPR